jgi:hypothetical protein
MVGKHGDTALGEIDVLESLRTGLADCGFISKLMLDRRDLSCPGEEKLDIANMLKIPVFDHCQFDCLSSLSLIKRDSFQKALFQMDFNKKEDRGVMVAEGVKEKWVEYRESGYDAVCSSIENEENSIFPRPLHSIESNPFKLLSIISD